MNQLLVFTLNDQRYGLPIFVVERIVRVVEITPLPKSPAIILGIINIQGRVIPVINIRRCLGLPERDITLSDQLIIANTAQRTIAFVVDAVTDVIEHYSRNFVAAQDVFPSIEYIENVVKVDDGLVLIIHDLDRLLAPDEKKLLPRVIKNV
jgi:purine-binding chemotaxis protein CheW